jgi:TonB family protein
MNDLEKALFPEFMAVVPTTDWWESQFRYVRSDGNKYKLISAGADKTFDEASWSKRGTLVSADEDAVIENGYWIRQWDKGTRAESAESRHRKTLKPSAQALLDQADARYEGGHYAAALEAYMDAVKADPAAADLAAIMRYGPIPYYLPDDKESPAEQEAKKQRINKGMKRQADALRQYLQLRSGDWSATTELLLLVELPEAESLLEPFFKSRPRDPELYTIRATLRTKYQRYFEAIDDYEKVIELDPQNAERYYVTGVAAYEAVAKNDRLTADQKRQLIRRGIAALDKAEALRVDYAESIAYRSLLLRQQAIVEEDPQKKKNLTTAADAVRQHASDLLKQRRTERNTSAAPPPEQSEPLHVGGDVKAPVVVHRVEATYPEEARKRGVNDIAILELVIDKTGHVVDAKILKDVPYGGSEAALAAVKQWTFKPGTRNGQPVDVVFNLTVRIGADRD